MMEPGLIAELRTWAQTWGHRRERPPRLLVVDPGLTTGLVVVDIDGSMSAWTVKLSALPTHLDNVLAGPTDAVIVEDYSAHGHNVDPKAYAAIGKGMVWSACDRRRLPMFLLQPNTKKSGRAKLDEDGQAARAAAKNEHQRDAIDLAGKALHEIRKAIKNA